MKKFLLLSLFTVFLVSCSSESKIPEKVIPEEELAPLPKTLGEQPVHKPAKKVASAKKTKKAPKKIEKQIKKTSLEKVEETTKIPPIRDIFLVRISSDYDGKTYDLAVQIDEKEFIKAIKVRNNKKNKVKFYGLDRLDKEIVLVKTAGISLVTLKCIDFSADKGCLIEIEYPYNVTYGNFDTFSAEIRKDQMGWRFMAQGRAFRQMKLISNKLFGLLVGIEEVELAQ